MCASKEPSSCSIPDQASLAAYLAAHPNMTARDFKGKGFDAFHPFDKDYVAPGELPWHTLDPEQVRAAATSEKARFLSKAVRQAAGRDPELVFDDLTGSYRRRSDTPPAPSRATGGCVEGVPTHESS